MQKPQVLVIVGPTASGKSSLAIKLAKEFDSEIISADSRQVYKGLDIGTGKVTREEMEGIPHHLLDVASPREQFSVSQYQNLGSNILKQIIERKKLPIVVGGTGFYIDALAGKISLPDVPPDKLLREKLNRFSKEELFKMLLEKDPTRASNIDKDNKLRLIRALEIVEFLGKVPPPSYSLLPTTYDFIFIGLKPDKEVLEERIKRRVKKMFKKGLLNEIKKLKKLGITNKRLKELGFEYWNPTEASVILGSKQYAKRQMTWFKRNKNIKWFKPEDYEKIEKYLEDLL